MAIWDLMLAGVVGMIGFLVTMVGQRLVKGAHVRAQFRHANEDLVVKVQELVRAHNEVLLLELEVQELVEKIEPTERARWLVRTRELAHALPPMVLAQLDRFGLKHPPPPIEVPPLPATRQHAVEADEQFAQVIQHPSPWTGRVAQ